MITFMDNGGSLDVFLDKKYVGLIKRVPGGYQYYAKGDERQENGGDVFGTKEQCKQSIDLRNFETVGDLA